MCVCVCVRVCVRVYVCMCMYVCMRMYVCMHACMHACMYVSMYTGHRGALTKDEVREEGVEVLFAAGAAKVVHECVELCA